MNTMEMPLKVTETLIDQWVKNCQVLATAQTQAEALTRSWMDQNQNYRLEGQKAVAQMAETAKENQRLFQEMVQTTVRISMESYRQATAQTVNELQNRVEILTKQVENLTRVSA